MTETPCPDDMASALRLLDRALDRSFEDMRIAREARAKAARSLETGFICGVISLGALALAAAALSGWLA